MGARCVPCEVQTERRLTAAFEGIVSTNPGEEGGGGGGTHYYNAINVEVIQV